MLIYICTVKFNFVQEWGKLEKLAAQLSVNDSVQNVAQLSVESILFDKIRLMNVE